MLPDGQNSLACTGDHKKDLKMGKKGKWIPTELNGYLKWKIVSLKIS